MIPNHYYMLILIENNRLVIMGSLSWFDTINLGSFVTHFNGLECPHYDVFLLGDYKNISRV